MAKNYADQMQEEQKKAPAYINIKGIIPKGGSAEDAIGIKGQGRVSFPLDDEHPMHKALIDGARNSETGTVTITLKAEVRAVDAGPEVDLSNVELF